jgi:hypothetical protein
LLTGGQMTTDVNSHMLCRAYAVLCAGAPHGYSIVYVN